MASNSSEVVYEASSEMDGDDDVKVVSATSDLLEEECTSEHDVFEKPACLIYTNGDELKINNNVLSQLSQIKKKISVVGICGLYRSGKSYLMNLIAGEKKGFELGDTIQSKTKGIWIWCKDHPKKKDQVLILIDTEGLDDPEKADPEHDNNLFCLTLLISSTLVINVKGVLDYAALNKLAFITQLSKRIQILNEAKDDKQNASFLSVASPKLVVCLRDFFLKSIKDGKLLTPDEYLKDSLKPVESQKANVIRFNEIKAAITTYFPKKKCFTVAQPATGEALQNVDSLDENALDKKFIEDIEALKKYVYERKPKCICNQSKKPIDGADLAQLITSHIQSIREDTPIRCEDAYTQTSLQHNERALQNVLNDFKKEMEKGKTMTSKIKLNDLFLKLFENTLKKYRADSFVYLQEEFEEKATEQMKNHFETMKEELKTKSKKLGSEKLSDMYDTMLEENLRFYLSSDGDKQYETDMDNLQATFFKEMKDYDKDDLCMALEELRKSKKDERMMVYRAANEGRALVLHRQYEEELSRKMKKSLEDTLAIERAKRDKYLEDELEKLRAENAKLSKFVKEKGCSIM